MRRSQTEVQKLINDYSFQYPQNSLPQLLSIYKSLENSRGGILARSKNGTGEADHERVHRALYGSHYQDKMFAVQGDSLQVNFVADNRLGGNVKISSIHIRGNKFTFKDELPADENISHSVTVLIPSDAEISQPYWLVEPMSKGSYNVSDQTMIGKPQNDPQSVEVNLSIEGQELSYTIPIQYKSSDPVKGETFEPLFIIPKIEVESNPELALGINDKPVNISVTTTVNSSSGKNFKLKEDHSSNVIETKKGEASFYSIKNPETKNTEFIDWSASNGNQNYDSYKTIIEYPHIPNIIYFKKAESKLVSIDLKTSGKKIGYIPGAGDKVPDALQKMGYQVTMLSPKDITPFNLKQYDAIITGVRAYNIYQWLNDSYNTLMNYVKDGGVLLVQYNTNNNIGPLKAKIGPYPFTITRARVTDENAEVKFVNP